MKRGIVFIFVILLLLPSVAATISISGPSDALYNIGDTIDVEGYVFQEEELSGFLQIVVDCSNTSFPRQLVPIDLNAGEQQTFSQIGIPDIIVTSSMSGSCQLEADVLAGGIPLESTSSDVFSVTKELEGLFSLDQNQVQMGDAFKLSGTITKMNEEKITGTAEIYFEQEGVEYLIDSVAVYGGTLSYTYDSSNTYPGNYDLNLLVRDSYGNEQRFDSIETFEIVDELSVVIDLEEETLYPGEMVIIYGSVKNINQELVNQATVEITVDDEELTSTSLISGSFTYEVEANLLIGSGEHTITVDVNDIDGNSGTDTTTFEILPVATKLENSLSNTSFDPEDILDFEVFLYDQAEELMDGSLLLEVRDSAGDLVSEKQVASSTDLSYKIPQFATPGTWTIKSSVGEIQDEDTLIVNEIEDMQMWVEGEILYIRNMGNTRYREDLQVLVSGAGYDNTLTKKKSIGVNETIEINLANEVPSGNYAIELPTGNALLNVDNVEVVNGTTRYKLGWLYILLAVVFIGGLSYLVYGRVPRKQLEPTKRRFGKKTPTVTMADKPKKEKKPSLTFEKEKGIKDFRERVVRDIKATEAKIEKNEAMKKQSVDRSKLATVLGKTEPKAAAKAPQKQESGNFFKLFD